MAVLLIGSTGNGKSTLGNFLIDPSEDRIFNPERQRFKTAQTNMPETQFASAAAFRENNDKITIIDTPGLNESEVSDLKHMIQIIDKLRITESVYGCILVVKFNTKIDAQYKATLRYYRKLLPSLFERNVIIVMTDFQSDARSVQIRERQRIDVEQIKKNTVREVTESGSLEYEPLLFVIDCLPYDEEERKLNLSVRSAIIDKLVSQTPFSSKTLMVAKTSYVKEEDNKEIKKYEGEIVGYNKRLQQVNERAKTTLVRIEQKEGEVTHISKQMKTIQQDLSEKDSADLIDIGKWSTSREWKAFQWIKEDFEVSSTCDIENVEKWTNGRCEWKDVVQTKNKVSGKVKGHFMRGIYASITLQSPKRRKYVEDIKSLKQKISDLEKDQDSYKKQLAEIRDRHMEYTNDIDSLEKFIAKNRQMIENLVGDYMTLDDARKRLATLQEIK